MSLYSLTDTNFQDECFRSDMPVLVEFTAYWCKPCKVLEPIIEKISDDKKGKAHFFIVDVDDCPRMTQEYGVKGLPAVIVFRDAEEIGRIEGVTTREKILELLGV
ncbi:TPA: thioredoxin fold domain-containing protein [Bacillus toyonensis]|nr:thioredoxin fold domain-containing protein [Bacillus toyonensis]